MGDRLEAEAPGAFGDNIRAMQLQLVEVQLQLAQSALREQQAKEAKAVSEADAARELQETQHVIGEAMRVNAQSQLAEQYAKEAKAQAESQAAHVIRELTERHAATVELPKITIGGKS